MNTHNSSLKTPTAFFNRRMHSIFGLWLVVYLFEHLLTNSEAAFLIGSDGEGFVTLVNFIHSLPFLKVIEVLFIGVPLVVHTVLGIKYLMTSKQNSYVLSDSEVSLPEYPRNQAYTWQRITSWILLVLITFHVVQMRFLNYPESGKIGNEHYHMVKVDADEGLSTLSARIGVTLYDSAKIAAEKEDLTTTGSSVELQAVQQKNEFIKSLKSFKLKNGEAVAVSPTIGTAFLMNVRDTFKSPLMLMLYTIFVLSAVFHACNGIWTFAITWGIPFSMRGQKIVKRFALVMMTLLAFLGLSAVWGSYLINLRY